MRFRQERVDQKRSAAERAWIERHGPTLKQMGLPPVVYLDYDHWEDFLENGHIHFHADPTNFEFTSLSREQMARLRRFLEEQHGSDSRVPGLLGFLRVRFGLCRACGYDLRAVKDACPKCGTWGGAAAVARK